MKRGQGTGFGDWVKANVQRKGKKARIQLKREGEFTVLNKFPENLPTGVSSIQFNQQKREVNAFKPINGLFEFTTEKFSHKEGKPPVPTHKVDNWGNDVYQFVAILKILNDKTFGDCSVPYILHAKFEPVLIERDGKEVQALGTAGYGKRTEELENYLQVTGVWDRNFQYKDNPLPMLQKAILEVGATFQGQMENGWITSLYASSKPAEDSDFDGGDTAPWTD